MADIEELCPSYVGERRIALSLRTGQDGNEIPRAEQTVDISVDYEETLPSGVMLPLDLVITGPSERAGQWREYDLFAPDTIVFVPAEPGEYTVALRERHHNQWHGSLTINVL